MVSFGFCWRLRHQDGSVFAQAILLRIGPPGNSACSHLPQASNLREGISSFSGVFVRTWSAHVFPNNMVSAARTRTALRPPPTVQWSFDKTQNL